jgi:acyl-CoA hydrolase
MYITPKYPRESITTHTDFVLPGETNPLNNLFGGELLARIDKCCGITARRHTRRVCVTASVNHVSFSKPIPSGAVVTVVAKVSRAFNTSLEVIADITVEDRETGDIMNAGSAIYTFVAVNDMGAPVQVPEVVPETDEEKERYNAALRRKQLSLILAGRLNPHDATELKALFVNS